ncbi:MAG: hypothetical protein ACFFBS_01805 [Promethearchaeota archaeon]
MRSERKRVFLFIILFVAAGFIMKILAEVVHELVGHGTFIVAFGGVIRGIYISLLWPYELSGIFYDFPGGVSEIQLALVMSGGIVACLTVSFIVQGLLSIKRIKHTWVELSLFWLAFWCLVNGSGYLIMGGLGPFGDIWWLIGHGFITPILAIIFGTVLFLIGFLLLSRILRRNLMKVLEEDKAKLGVTVFWSIIPLLVILTTLGWGGIRFDYFAISFVPVFVSWIMEHGLKRKSEIRRNTL